MLALAVAILFASCSNDGPSVKYRPQGSLFWKAATIETILSPDGDGNGKMLPEDVFAEYDGIRKGPKITTCSHCRIVSGKQVDVRIKIPGVDTTLFALKPGSKDMLFPQGDPVHGISLCVDAPFGNVSHDGFRETIVFHAGWHDAGNDPRIQPDSLGFPVIRIERDSVLVILEEGARVCASFDLVGASHVRICGGGYIDQTSRCHPEFGGFRTGVVPSVYIHRGCKDVAVEGITIMSEFRPLCARCSRDISVKDVKMFSSAANSDAVNLINCCNVDVRNCLLHSQDDCFCAYNSCDSITFLWDYDFEWPHLCSDISLSGSILWTSCRPLVFGGHASGNETERDVIERVTVSDCEIAGIAYNIFDPMNEKKRSTREFWSGVFRILSQSGQIVRDIDFHDIIVRDAPGYDGQSIHLCVRGSKTSYREKSGWRIENVHFKDITFIGGTEMMPPFYGWPEGKPGAGISGIVLENVSVGGKPLNFSDFYHREGLDGDIWRLQTSN